jgi:hypothetical protein
MENINVNLTKEEYELLYLILTNDTIYNELYNSEYFNKDDIKAIDGIIENIQQNVIKNRQKKNI